MANYTWPSQSAGTVTIAAVGVNGATAPTSSIEVGTIDGSGNLSPLTQGQAAMVASIPVVIASNQTAVPASQSGTWNITNVSGTVSLPTGASTSALQTTGNTSLSSIDGKITAVNTGAVVVSSSALPSGASTSALQTTGNTSIASIDTKTPALGQAAMASSVPVAIASNQSALPASQSGTWTVQPGNTANTTAWKVDGSAVTQPVSGTVTAKHGTPTAGTVTQGALTIGTSAARATVSGSAPAATRSLLMITPDSASTGKFYLGSSGVTSTSTTRGIQLLAGQTLIFNDDAGDYYIISDTASQTVYVMEQA